MKCRRVGFDSNNGLALMLSRSFVAAAILIAAVPLSCPAELIHPRVVALMFENAPGTNEQFRGFSAPTISANSEVGFFAGVSFTTDPSQRDGIWSEVNGSLSLIARRGMVPTGFPPGSGFQFGSSSPQTTVAPFVFDGGQTVFGSSYDGVTTVWSGGPSSNLSPAIITGLSAPTSVPGTLFQSAVAPSLRVNASGSLATIATLQSGAGGATAGNSRGIWTGLPGSLELLARQGFDAPGTSGGDFSEFEFPVFTDTGTTAFVASLAAGTGDVSSVNNVGIWRGTASSLEMIAREGEVAPGAGGELFKDFRQVSINNAGALAVLAELVPSNGRGVWRTDGDVLSPVVLPGDSVPGLSGDVSFGSAAGVVLNGQGAIAFKAFLNGADAGPSQGESVWVNDGANLRMLARVGDPVPGTNGTMTFVADNGFDFFPFMNELNQVVFQSRIAIDGVLGSRDAIFAYDLSGDLLMSIKYGDEIEVGPGDYRTITDLRLPVASENMSNSLFSGSGEQDGRRSPLNDRGQLAFAADFAFSDGGVFVVQVPEPTTIVLSSVGAIATFCMINRRKRLENVVTAQAA